MPDSLTDPARYVLWIGRAESVHKRPQICVELARSCPGVTFLMVLNPRDKAVEETIHRSAPANVYILPRVPFPAMPALFSRAAALLNTSQLEGFPNVFLQAALSRVPIVSLEVGQDFLKNRGGGIFSDGDVATAANAIQSIWQQPPGDIATACARDYVIREHGTAQQSERLLQTFHELASS